MLIVAFCILLGGLLVFIPAEKSLNAEEEWVNSDLIVTEFWQKCKFTAKYWTNDQTFDKVGN